jgi:tetratricopeptide (TPR) repeat protein
LFAALPAYAQTRPRPDAAAISAADLSAYVRARAADANGDAAAAASGYALALNDVPDDAIVATRAYRQALMAGDYALAARAAASLTRSGAAPADAAILQVAVALKARDRAGIDAALVQLGKGPLGFMAPVLTAWLAFDRHEDALAQLDTASGTALARRYAAEHRALLLLASRKTGEGMAELRQIFRTSGPDQEDLRIDAALVLAATGKKKDAQALLDQPRLEFTVLRGNLGRGVKPNANFGAARLFLSLAVDLAQEEVLPLSVVLTRAALLLDPTDDRARLYLAEALSRAGSHRLAMSTLAEVKPSSPFARGAEAGMVAALRRAGRTDEAIARARALAGGKDATNADAQTLGDLLSDNNEFDAAAAAYAAGIARPDGANDWTLAFLHGIALNRAGHWPEAQAALRRAVALAPDKAIALTYLGYSQVEHGENLVEAQAMLEQARKLRPGDSRITDSLAWAYYLGGDAKRALPMLEGAAQADPSGSRVNEHLGDVYWKLGRRYEARYAWRAARLSADAGDVARIEAKLANGLTAAN